jgi:chromosome partitioning protein
MARIIAIVNQKGGVGKTTTCVNLAAALALLRQRVLLVDLDPQGNATTGSGLDKHQLDHTICDVLLAGMAAATAIVPTPKAGYDLLPANGELTSAEVGLTQGKARGQRLQTALDSVQAQYDFILIDCPPSLNMLTVNALIAAQGVIIPLQCEYYALEGLSALVNTVEKIRQSANPNLRIDGILRTMFDARNNLANDVSAQIMAHFADVVYRSVIPRNVRLAEAPSHGLPIQQYDANSRGAVAYLALASEIVGRCQKLTAMAELAAASEVPAVLHE